MTRNLVSEERNSNVSRHLGGTKDPLRKDMERPTFCVVQLEVICMFPFHSTLIHLSWEFCTVH